MPTVHNKTPKPLSIPLPGGKKLHLGPGKTAQISANAVDSAGLKKLVESGDVEVVIDDAHSQADQRSGKKGRTFMPGHASSSTVRSSGDR